MFINIHSHQAAAAHNIAVLQNQYRHFNTIGNTGNYSLGLHPWYITEAAFKKEMEQLEQFSQNNNVLAIGECGLDKICHTDFYFQQLVFAAQITLANKIHKPLLIHCVRAYEEVQGLLNQHKNKMPVIFHGFNKNKMLAQQLISKGYYLSFGKALQQSTMQQLITTIPADKIFLETDDNSDNIETVYAWAAEALQIDINSLSLQIQKNAVAVFGAAWF